MIAHKQRLSKIVAAAGVASRRKAEELIRKGHVTVNGKRATEPQTMVDSSVDVINVDGKRIAAEQKVYYMLHKPIGYLCTSDPEKTKRVIDLFKEGARLFTVGRLDRDTSGLILVTNDGLFANAVIHPSKGWEKEYLVKVDKEVEHEHLVKISKGTVIEKKFIRPARVAKVRRGTLKIVVREGKKREVRSLVERVGLEVKELKRIRIGPLVLGSLPYGSFRHLSEKEKQSLLKSADERKVDERPKTRT